MTKQTTPFYIANDFPQEELANTLEINDFSGFKYDVDLG